MRRFRRFLLGAAAALLLAGAVVFGGSDGKERWVWLRQAAASVADDGLLASVGRLLPEGPSSFAVEIAAEHAVLLDAVTGEVLLAKNERKRLYPASTTKILTALIALETGDPDALVTVGPEVNEREPEESSAGLVPGQRLALRDLLHAMMLASGNDAARTVAVHIAREHSGDRDLGVGEALAYFAGLMNERARLAGAHDSHFVNPHGLHDRRHYSTAADLALIAREAMADPRFRETVGAAAYEAAVFAPDGASARLTFVNRNLLLHESGDDYYAGATGVKTGFTDQAGYCLVSSAERNGRQLIAVVMNSTSSDVWSDSRRLLDYGFAQ